VSLPGAASAPAFPVTDCIVVSELRPWNDGVISGPIDRVMEVITEMTAQGKGLQSWQYQPVINPELNQVKHYVMMMFG